MDNSNPEVEIDFRFLSLNKLQAYTLEREIIGSSYRKHRKSDCYVGCVPLTKSSIDDINDFYVRQMIDIAECDIFVSVVSKSDSSIVDVPVVANRMLKYIDCKLTYSFTVV
ncbi:MAG: hypothetical protein QNK36_17630 [Colwellia sp.]|nr:hypothetical protein [Colwellia sp.]